MLETITTEIAKHGINAISDWLKREHSPELIESQNIEQGLVNHLRFAKNWCREFLLRDMARSRSLNEIFVESEFSPGTTSDEGRKKEPISYKTFLTPGVNRIIYGYPGAGKTTLIMRLCNHLIFDSPEGERYYDFPLLIRFRELVSTFSLVDHLLAALNIHVNPKYEIDGKPIEQSSEKIRALKEQVLFEFLNSRTILLLLDGLDEVSYELRNRFKKEIEAISANVDSSDFILTTRTQTTVGELKRVEQYFLRPFNIEGIKSFVSKWFKNIDESRGFLSALSKTPYAGSAVRPLTLATFCILFERYGEIPSPPKEIYRRIVNMYLEKWDELRDIKRVSQYGRFGPDRKREFLSSLTFELAKITKGIQFTTHDLRKAYQKLHRQFGLPVNQESKILEEIESHNGLIVQAGFEKYEFYHKSIQEYFCADVLSRMPVIPTTMQDWVKLPDACAIACSLTADPNALLANMVTRLTPQFFVIDKVGVEITLDSFWTPFLTRCRIEEVFFYPDNLLGLCFLSLCSFGWSQEGSLHHYKKRKYYDSYLETLTSFSKHEAVIESLRKLKSRIHTTQTTNAWFRLIRLEKTDNILYGEIPQEFIIDIKFKNLL